MKTTAETKESILGILANSPLTESAFDCAFDLEDGSMVSVTVKGQEYFYYRLQRSDIKDKEWEVHESPGAVFHGAETSRFPTLEEAIAYMGDWVGRIVGQVNQAKRSASQD